MAPARVHNEPGDRRFDGTDCASRETFSPISLARRRRAGSLPAPEIDPSAEQRVELIAPLQLFAGLPRLVLWKIAERAQTLRIAKGCHLFKHGETHSGMYIVIYGKVQLLLPKTAEDEKVLADMERGMIFGEAAMFLNVPLPVSARATEDTLVIFIPRETLNLLLAARPEFAVRLLVCMSKRLHNLTQDIAGYTQKTASNRIAAYLLEQVQQGGSRSILLADRKQAIASRLSVAPETLSRTLGQMQKNGIIRVGGYQIEVLDIKGLGRLAEN